MSPNPTPDIAKLIRRAVLGMLLAATARGGTPAYAEPPPHSNTRTAYEFDDTQVQGEHPSPTQEILQVRRRRDRESLIRVREHFLPELYKSVEAQ